MSDLENLWNDLDAGSPPTAEVLRSARRRRRARRLRPLVAVGAVAALSAAFVAGGQLTRPTSDDGPVVGGTTPVTDLAPVAFHADLQPADSCGDLLATYRQRALGLVGPYGWDGQMSPYLHRLYPAAELADNARAPAPTTAQQGMADAGFGVQRRTASGTGTNTQEAAVDEPDTVKTDGSLLVRLRGSQLVAYDVTGEHVKRLSTLPVDGVREGELLLDGEPGSERVLVIGADPTSPRDPMTGERRGSRVLSVDLSDPTEPAITDEVTYSARVEAARQTGAAGEGVVRLVLDSGLPDLDFTHPHRGVTTKQAAERNRRAVRRSTLADWLPTYNAGNAGNARGGRADLLDCDTVAVPQREVPLDTTTVVTFATADPAAPRAFGLAGDTTISYQSADALFLASSGGGGGGCFGCPMIDTIRPVSGGTTYLFEFDLTDDQAVSVASGEVEGTIRDRWSMDYSGHELRVLVRPSSETARTNSIVLFHRRDDRLVETGRLDGVGHRFEEVRSVRWQRNLALVVTYRQVDPLYVIDLRGKNPSIHSELTLPGYSGFLQPLGRFRLVGVGEGPRPKADGGGWGAQLGLFGVHDLSEVKPLDTIHYARNTYPQAESDPRALTWLPEHRTVVTLIRHGDTGYLSIDELADQRLQHRMLEVEHGSDVAAVRVIGLPDGKVALVTGEDVRFLRLD
ncbi:beta-propeller domain-containing protein [Nocardioides acrostichi]|uniref:Beta-propeller domain-containing protein n=1 Tax=Nocardioides acrostichi TaxID=2784339 RepID=A0A930V2T9_9ACTN|nr:beta-propeller domain-containing protein [Nocardioides acrostichi]MBF4162767.1 beta-propeller domain-containing protein [Nocardioides acrostichi]